MQKKCVKKSLELKFSVFSKGIKIFLTKFFSLILAENFELKCANLVELKSGLTRQ